MRAVYTAYIALGSNLGDRAGHIAAAVTALRQTPGLWDVRTSSLLENPAVGMAEGTPPFLNGVAEARTVMLPRALLDRLLEVERALGRERRNRASPGSRPIDLDLLLYGDRVIDEPDLKLPHPRMHERRFVLEPLAELAPGLIHPTRGETVSEMLEKLRPSKP